MNIILLFIWAFGSSTNLNKKNYAPGDADPDGDQRCAVDSAGGVIMGIFRGMMGSYY